MSEKDIIELTDIVKMGNHTLAQEGANAVPKADNHDYGADLDKFLSNPSSSKAQAELTPEVGVDIKKTPDSIESIVALEVDPDEEIELPALDDLDALLEELGVSANKSDAAKTSKEEQLGGEDLSIDSETPNEEVASTDPFEQAMANQNKKKQAEIDSKTPNEEPVSADPFEQAMANQNKKKQAEIDPEERKCEASTKGEQINLDLTSDAEDILIKQVQDELGKQDSDPQAPEVQFLKSKNVDITDITHEERRKQADEESTLRIKESVEQKIAETVEKEAIISPTKATQKVPEANSEELDALLEDVVAAAPKATVRPVVKSDHEANQGFGHVKLAKAEPKENDELSSPLTKLKDEELLLFKSQLAVQRDEIEGLRAEIKKLQGGLDASIAKAAAKIIREEIAALMEGLK